MVAVLRAGWMRVVAVAVAAATPFSGAADTLARGASDPPPAAVARGVPADGGGFAYDTLAGSGVAPDRVPAPESIERLRSAARRHFAVVWCRAGRFELPGVKFDSTGIWSSRHAVYRGPRVALVEGAGASRYQPPPKPIPWNTVDSVAVGSRPRGPMVALAGTAVLVFVVGLTVTGFTLAAVARTGRPNNGVLAVVALPVAAAGSMAAIVLISRDRIQVVYRAAPRL